MKKTLTINYSEYSNITELPLEDSNLLLQAKTALQNAYAPYSNFKVGAAVLLENNEIVLGSNQENIAYPSGLCAERVALFYAGANFPTEKIRTLAVAAEGDLVDFDAILSPCGACRQVIFESEKRQQTAVRILIMSMNGRIIEFEKSTDLLTFAFGL
jgi:cytidine deaminase